MLVQTVTVGDYKANLYQTQIGYQYKIFTKINNQNTCVARSYAYIHHKGDCYNQMMNDLNAIMGIKQLLF